MNYEKHVGIYQTKEELIADISNLISPWVGYVVKPEGGFEVYYSNDMGLGTELNIAEQLEARVTNLENSIVTLSEDEYDALVTLEEGVQMEITHVDGKKEMVSYDPSKYYYTYDSSDLPNIEE